MCGIACYVGKGIEILTLANALKKLEYRGYDSSGISYIDNGEIKTIKKVGKIDNLIETLPVTKTIHTAISHTRWATHGKPNHENAHPLTSKNSEWTIVHNGIIENYLDLKNKLKYKVDSANDTAILAEYLEEKAKNNMADFIKAFREVKGSYAIVAINKNEEDSLYIAKNKSPLFIGKTSDGVWIASDPISLPKEATLYELSDKQFAKVSVNNIYIYDNNYNKIDIKPSNIENIFSDSLLGKYPHYMLKEIEEESVAILKQVEYYKTNNVLNEYNNKFIKQFNYIKFIGCGTAYHAGLMGARFAEKLLGIRASCEIASEFIYKKPMLDNKNTLFILISQSGETADTLSAMEIIKENGFTHIALTNVMYSTLARKSQYVLPTLAGPEIAVASTKAYTCQLTSLYMLTAHLHNALGKDNINYYYDISNIATQILNFDRLKLDKIARTIYKSSTAIFLGKDLDYITANEASLKLKEISYINSASYPSGELKHGFLALVEEGTPLIVFAMGDDIQVSKTLNASHESIARGAHEILITNRPDKGKVKSNQIYVDCKDPLLSQILAIAPMQYLAYRVSILKGLNPDKPRNLAKSVTVE